MASVATESKHEMDIADNHGLALAGLPFEVKQGFGDKYLEYSYEGRPLVIYCHLPWFAPIVKLMEQYRDLERQTALLVKQRDEAISEYKKAKAEGTRKKGSNHE